MKMNQQLARMGTCLALVTMMSSCANIQNDRTRTRTEGGLAGAALGAAAGAIIGHQSGRAWEGAAIGAAAGGVAGVAYGNHVANKKARYASKEAWLDDCIASAERENANAVAYNRSLESNIARLNRQIAAARSSNNRAEQRRLKTEVATLNREALQEIRTLDNEIAAQSSVVTETQSSTLNQRVSTLKSTRSSLNTNQKRLADLGNQIDV